MSQNKKPIFTSTKRDTSWGKRMADPYEEQALLRETAVSKTKWIRVPLLGFNCVLWILGVILMVVGGYALYQLKGVQSIANFTVPVGFLIIGIFITILTMAGCVVGFRGRLKGLIVYTILMFIFFVALIGVGGYAFEARNEAPKILATAWAHASDNQRAVLENFFVGPTLNDNGTQPCCGWEDIGGSRTYPSTSCKITPNNSTIPQNITYERAPCSTIIVPFVQSKLTIAGVAGVVIGIIEFFSVLFSFILIVRLGCASRNKANPFSYPL